MCSVSPNASAADGRGGVHRAAAGDASAGSTCRRRLRACAPIVATARPASAHASAASMPAPTPLDTMATTAARRDRLGRHQHGRLEQFAEAGGGDDARLVEQRLPGDQRRGGRRGVRGGGPLARGRPPGVDGQDGDAWRSPGARSGRTSAAGRRTPGAARPARWRRPPPTTAACRCPRHPACPRPRRTRRSRCPAGRTAPPAPRRPRPTATTRPTWPGDRAVRGQRGPQPDARHRDTECSPGPPAACLFPGSPPAARIPVRWSAPR